jgi:hypothetical protein
MTASALIKYSQAPVVGGDGLALLGVLGVPVFIHNVNNSGVASWQIEVAYADPESSVFSAPIPFAFNDNSSTPSTSFIPDVRGSYRFVLKVWSTINRVGDPDSIDIRVFAVPELNGFVTAPSQVYPLPLPDPRTGDVKSKPDELNFGGQLNGWAGNGNTDGLMTRLLRAVDGSRVLPFQFVADGAGPYEICRIDSSKWNPHMYIRAVFDVLVDNDEGANFGYFNRTSIFKLDSARNLTHLATGESLYTGVSPTDGAVGLSTAHAIAVTADIGQFLSVVATPSGSGPGLDLVWKVSAQFFFTQR